MHKNIHCCYGITTLIFSLFFIPASTTIDTLEQVQVFFRHGERIPTSILTFPSEKISTKKLTDLQLQPGEMTLNGMRQEYALGKRFREIYGQFVGPMYRSLEIRVNSGSDNRTIASAQLAMASFLPPISDQIWNEELLWYPVPFRSEEIIDHASFGMFDHCPSLRTRIQNSAAYKNLNKLYAQSIIELEKQTGMKIPNAYIFQKVLDTLISRAHLNTLLPLPEWAQGSSFMAKIKVLQIGVHSHLVDLFLDSLGGWHFDQIVSRMDEFANNRTKQKIIFYAGHDTNMLTLGRFLQIDLINSLMPAYASYLAFELHKMNATFYVTVRFRPTLDSNPIELEFAHCKKPCSLESFAALGRTRTTSPEWISICRNSNNVDLRCTVYEPIMGGLVVLISMLIVLGMWACCRKITRKPGYDALNSSDF